MPRKESAYLLDMVLAARKALSFTDGMSFAQFERDTRAVFAATKAIEIVGEAAAQVTRDTRQAHPDIPWRDIIAMRNRLVHAYFDINLRTHLEDGSPRSAGLDRPP